MFQCWANFAISIQLSAPSSCLCWASQGLILYTHSRQPSFLQQKNQEEFPCRLLPPSTPCCAAPVPWPANSCCISSPKYCLLTFQLRKTTPVLGIPCSWEIVAREKTSKHGTHLVSFPFLKDHSLPCLFSKAWDQLPLILSSLIQLLLRIKGLVHHHWKWKSYFLCLFVNAFLEA